MTDVSPHKNRTMKLFDKYGMQSVSSVRPVDNPAASVTLGQVRTSAENMPWIAQILANALTEARITDGPVSGPQIFDLIQIFYDDYLPSVPQDLRSKHGSTSDHGLLCNWILLKLIQPDAYVESGVFVGASLRLADTALPNIAKWAYDLSFAPLKYSAEHITYIQNEWFEEAPKLSGHGKTFAFFDDHIDPVQRILECHDVGIEWILFDDCPPFTRLNRYRFPAVPSVSMILDTDMPDGAIIEWKHASEDRTLRYTHDVDYCREARALISSAIDMYDMFTRVGMGCGDKVLVRLKKAS